jgi:CRISPR-associated protein Csc3
MSYSFSKGGVIVLQAEILQQVTKGFEAGTKVHAVLASFAETMLEPMIERYSLYPAKGTTVAHFAHNSDQMMLTHVLNGLFPTLTLVYEAQKRHMPRLSRLGEEELKVYVLAYTMHDLDKILGDAQKFHTRTRAAVIDAYQKLVAELEKLNAHAFLPNMDDWVSEILWLAINTQRSRDINLAHTSFVPLEAARATDEAMEVFRPQIQHFRKGIESTLRDLCTLSDLLAFFVKAPDDALLSQAANRTPGGILSLIEQLTDNNFTLAYHKLAEVRGFLSNQINNGTLRYLSALYPADQEPLIPFLYFPNGVVYLNPLRRPDPIIDRQAVKEAVQGEIWNACSDMVNEGTGLGFDPKGRLAYPRYFHDFLSLQDFLALFVKKTLSDSKANIAENTLQAMQSLQAKGAIVPDIDLNYAPSKNITQLGRFLINYVDLFQKNLDKNAAHLKTELERRLMLRFGSDLWDKARLIPSSGGVDYRYYWLAAQYLAAHPLAEYEVDSPGASLEGLFQQCIADLLAVAERELASAPELQGAYLQDLSDYLDRNLAFGFSAAARIEALPDFAGELAGYAAAKKVRGGQLSCTICNSAYTTRRQEDAAVLFQPWVYKNRLLLYRGENAGGICSICSLELMLRQVLLKDRPGREGRINLTGRSYEDMELKYFFLYPGFFFTNQTYRLTNYIVNKMSNLKLYEVCEVLREKEHLSSADILRLSFFKFTQSQLRAIERNEQGKQEEQEEKGGMYLFDRYEENQYPGFLFFAKKTFSKKNKSGESSKATVASWVEAAWLGLALPLVTGTRVVVTEEYLPLYNSAADFLETVVLDAPHQAIRYLLPQSSARLRLDELYGQRRHDGESEVIGGAMSALSRAVELHIDTERAGGDLKFERFPRVARNVAADQLFIFAFLKEQMRRDKFDQIPGKKALHYDQIYRQFVLYYHCPEGDAMTANATRHERITDLYLQFYLPFNDKGTWPNSHAIVRPIDIAAKCILKDTLNLTADEIKIEMFQALKSWLDIVDKKGATGRVIAKGPRQDALIRQFVDTFYNEVFLGYAEGQRSVLNSRLNRFKGGCEAIFSLRYSKKRPETAEPHEEENQQ